MVWYSLKYHANTMVHEHSVMWFLCSVILSDATSFDSNNQFDKITVNLCR